MFDRDFWTRSRTISALIVAAYVALACWMSGADAALRLVGFCILPLACIWFPEYLGVARGFQIEGETPPVFISILGWVLLSLPGLVWLCGGQWEPFRFR